MVTSLFIHSIISDVAGRERPFGRLCVGDKQDSPECKASGRYRSFFSGHTSMSFTGASLVCNTHMHVPIYRQPGDTIACAAALGAAATVGTMRIVADKHYATDVLLGATTGMIMGFAMPWVFHYRGGAVRGVQGSGGSTGTPPIGGALAWKF
jgi:membrane-associated phospholipid phosphatase